MAQRSPQNQAKDELTQERDRYKTALEEIQKICKGKCDDASLMGTYRLTIQIPEICKEALSHPIMER